MADAVKGRGAVGNPAGRYEALAYAPDDDADDAGAPPPLRTTLADEACRTIISLLAKRFALACKRFGLGAGRGLSDLDCGQFRVPQPEDPQLRLL